MPFIPASQMPTITINGFNYGSGEPINLSIAYYIYSGGANSNDPINYYFHAPKISSSGSYTPIVYLSNEDGKVVIYINDKSYYQRFTVSVFAQGMSETSSWFQGWTTADEALSGTKTVEISYQNRFKGDVYLPGTGVWNTQGDVGIGTSTPDEKLTVKGKIHAQEVKVDLLGALVPDYVFANDYNLKTLSEIEKYIKENSHLPEIPSAKDFEKNGIFLAEMNMSLLKKVEELTLYLIEQDKKVNAKSNQIEGLKKDVEGLKKDNEIIKVLAERLAKMESKLR